MMKLTGRTAFLILMSLTAAHIVAAADFWTTKTSMPTSRYYLGAGVVNGRIYAIGSNGGKENEEYDPIADKWRDRADMPTARGELAVEVISKRLYAIGGYAGIAPLAVNEEYNPYMNVWRARASMPTARFGPAAGSAGGKIYVVGGSASLLFLSTNEEYTPDIPVELAEYSVSTGKPKYLLTVFPNPFRRSVTIAYQAPLKSRLALKIYDATGRVVKSFDLSSIVTRPSSFVYWDGRDDFGRRAAAGTYLVCLKTDNSVEVTPVVIAGDSP